MSRGGQVTRELLGEKFSGILVTDRSSTYNCTQCAGGSSAGRMC